MLSQPQRARLTPRDIPRFVIAYCFLLIAIIVAHDLYLPELHSLALHLSPLSQTAPGTILDERYNDKNSEMLIIDFTTRKGMQVSFNELNVVMNIADPYHPGQHVTVRYNTANPHDAVIESNPIWDLLDVLIWWGFFVMIGIFLVPYLKGNLRHGRQATTT